MPLRVARRSIRIVLVTGLVLWALILAPELQAGSMGAALVQKVGRWCRDQLISYAAGKAIDYATGQDFSQQIEQEIPRLVAQISTAIGPRRAVLQENLELDREQLAVLARLASSQGAKIAEIRADQESLLRRIDGLAARMTKLERRVDQLDSRVDELDYRVGQLEEALIRECLDLRSAPVLGADGFRVKESPGSWLADHFDSNSLSIDVRLLLNSCTGDLTQRGLLIQLSLVTRGLDRDISLYASFKGVSTYGYPNGQNLLVRQEYPLARPGYRVDGQVVELFFPYAEIPYLSPEDRTALALVLTHDGEVLYTLPDRAMSCVFGQRVNCRWER